MGGNGKGGREKINEIIQIEALFDFSYFDLKRHFKTKKGIF